MNAIPKIVHQIWLGPKKRPQIWMDSVKSFVDAHPGWTYLLWDEAALQGKQLHNQAWFDLEASYHGKADILRYELLYSFGGIYIDADSLLLPGKDLDQLLEEAGEKGLFAARGLAENGLITQGIVGAAPKHPVLLEMIFDIQKNYPKRMLHPPWISVGPKAFHAVVEKHPDEVHLFPTEYFYPGGWHFLPGEFEEKLAGLTPEAWKERFPDSYFVQFGYTTNDLGGHFEKRGDGAKGR